MIRVDCAVNKICREAVQYVLGGIDVGGSAPVGKAKGQKVSAVVEVMVGDDYGFYGLLFREAEARAQAPGIDDQNVIDEKRG